MELLLKVDDLDPWRRLIEGNLTIGRHKGCLRRTVLTQIELLRVLAEAAGTRGMVICFSSGRVDGTRCRRSRDIAILICNVLIRRVLIRAIGGSLINHLLWILWSIGRVGVWIKAVLRCALRRDLEMRFVCFDPEFFLFHESLSILIEGGLRGRFEEISAQGDVHT